MVKELLENAFDAGADTIHIDIGFGGLNQVKISDNGSGIISDDLPLAIAAHATSKITRLNDLYEVYSMGFRGEALASIAAISKLSLSSRPATQEHAMMLRVEGASSATIMPCARAVGTTVDVVDLFFNVPVRKKFLKSAASEYQAIEVLVKRFALSAPHIALVLRHNDKQMLDLPAATCDKTRLLRIKKILGKAFVEQATYLDIERAGMHLQGFVSGPTYQRSQNDKQWVYVNQRMMKDKLIQHAIKQAYQDVLHPGRHPSCLLYLNIPAFEVDVNVHPTKHEVRFQQPRLVHDFIIGGISDALAESGTPLTTPLTPLARTDVCETYTQHPLRASIREDASAGLRILNAHTDRCSVLNAQFGFVFAEDHPYLVDLAKAHQEYLHFVIHSHAAVLPSRPLLVPVRYTIEHLDRQRMDYYQPMLSALGIQLDWVGEKEVVVRTIPLVLPQLDIKKLLESLKGSCLDQADLLALVISCQSFDARQLNKDEMTSLLEHLNQSFLAAQKSSSCLLSMDIATCRDLFEGRAYA